MIPPPLPTPSPGPTAPTAQQAALRDRAEKLESFLFEAVLKASGTGSPGLPGGSDSQFESFLRRAQAEAVAGSGQTGLAEAIYRSLARGAAP
jgi:hypothetical protein